MKVVYTFDNNSNIYALEKVTKAHNRIYKANYLLTKTIAGIYESKEEAQAVLDSIKDGSIGNLYENN